MRERVDKLVAQSPHDSTGSVKARRPVARLRRPGRVPAGRRRRLRRRARRAARCRDGDELRAEGRRRAPATGVLRLQRRPGLGVDLAAPGRARPEARRRARRRQHADGAVRGRRQPAQLVRALRPRLHRPAAHRLVDDGERRGEQEAALGRRRRRRAERRRAALADAPQALGLAGLPRRRELRHDPRRGDGRQAAERRRRALGPDPDLVRDGPAEHRLRAAQRPAVCALPAGASPTSRSSTAC